MVRTAPILVLLTAAVSSAASAQSSRDDALGGQLSVYYSPKPKTVIEHTYFKSLQDLRAEAVSQQARDGGALSAASRAGLQARLDALNADYRRQLRNIDRFSVSGTGRPR